MMIGTTSRGKEIKKKPARAYFFFGVFTFFVLATGNAELKEWDFKLREIADDFSSLVDGDAEEVSASLVIFRSAEAAVDVVEVPSV